MFEVDIGREEGIEDEVLVIVLESRNDKLKVGKRLMEDVGDIEKLFGRKIRYVVGELMERLS